MAPSSRIACSLLAKIRTELLHSSSRPTEVVTLIGMPGGGKSTVGRLLAERLGVEFADTDLAIERRMGMSVGQIFDTRGEAFFRDLESEVLDSLVRMNPSVVATGGGSVLRPENRDLLREHTVPVYLQTSLPELWRRVRGNSRRPLLRGPSPYERLEQIYAERHPIYSELASIVVITGKPTVAGVVDTIVSALQR